MIILGIDPGLSGGIAALTVAPGSRPAILSIIDIPTCADGSNRQVDAGPLFTFFEHYKPHKAFIENVAPMPSIPGKDAVRRSMGATSAFRFGFAVGQLRMALDCYGIETFLIVPRVWKKHFGLVGPNKNQSLDLARELLPSSASFLTRKKDHNRAESALIAVYGSERMGFI